MPPRARGPVRVAAVRRVEAVRAVRVVRPLPLPVPAHAGVPVPDARALREGASEALRADLQQDGRRGHPLQHAVADRRAGHPGSPSVGHVCLKQVPTQDYTVKCALYRTATDVRLPLAVL